MLKGKNAVITGSTSGIGEGYARALAAEGCNVMINGFGDKSEIETLRSALESEHGIKCLYHGADMTKPDQITDMIATANKEFGGIDILINNAGIQHVAPIEEFPVDKWDAIIAINMSSAFHTIRNVIPIMKKGGWGRIVNTASAHALVASPNKSAYVTAKHGIAGLTKTAALEVARDNITVNAICPGYVWTPLVEKQIPDTAKTRGMSEQEVIDDVMLASAATKKFTTIEQVAALAVFLCSDAAENITGSLQSIDGGWTAQ
ncbi:3-hydroxybutyrate dehydrogenase [Sneathiella sp.]|uniref:3-hydroxybutyrate dehydrogenase n=1 Tax=Sneathiella sp. TaxID=1964365 RepID=UPI003565B720